MARCTSPADAAATRFIHAFVEAGDQAGYGLTNDYSGEKQEGFGPFASDRSAAAFRISGFCCQIRLSRGQWVSNHFSVDQEGISMLRLFAGLAVGCLTFMAPLPALAQSPLTLAGMSIYRHETLIDHSGNVGSICCAPYVLGDTDGHFVFIRAVFDVAWTDDLDRLSVVGM